MSIASILEPKNQIPDARKRFDNRALYALILPVVVERFLSFFVSIADTMMISHAGESAVSGVSLVTDLNNLFMIIFTAFGNGGAVVLCHYIGAQNHKMSSRTVGQIMSLALLAGMSTTGLMLLLGPSVFDLLYSNVTPEVRQAGITYMRISAYSFTFISVYCACCGFFRSIGDNKTIMFVSLLMNAINIIGNYIGVFILHAGVEGVAWPTLITHFTSAVVMTVSCMRSQREIRLKWKYVFKVNSELIKRIVKMVLPGIASSGGFQLVKVALTVIISGFGTSHITAYGVSSSLWAMAQLFIQSMNSPFMTVIGQYMGAGDHDGAKYYMEKMYRISIFGNILWNVLFTALLPLTLRFYALSNDTQQIVIGMVLIHAIIAITAGPMINNVSSGLNAAGDVKFTMYLSLVCTVIIRFAFSVFFCITLNLGAYGMILAIGVDWYSRMIAVHLRWHSMKWLK